MRLATIIGTAGVGKSALALHWAHRVQENFPDGQLFLNLRGFAPELPAADPGEALAGFLEALGFRQTRHQEPTEDRSGLLCSLLDGKRVLLVLDNARDVAQVRPLLPGSPGSMALVTSRDHLSGLVVVEGAQPITLGLLNDSEAIALLVARLGETRLADQRAAVRRIVSRCAGLPLALAVVAASSATQPGFTLDLVASDLDQHTLDALGGNDPQADTMGQCRPHQPQLGNRAEATDSYARSIEIYRDLGDRYNLVSTLMGLGDTLVGRGEEPVAWKEGLAIAIELRHPAEEHLRRRLDSQP